MKNKKKGSGSKTWAVDCRTDGAFDFAIRVLQEAKNKKYLEALRINFVRIAYYNSLETIAKAQTDPKEFKLRTAFKLFIRNLKEISTVAADLCTCLEWEVPSNIVSKHYQNRVILNPHDYVDIDYDHIEGIICQQYDFKDDTELLSCAKRYNFPKVYEQLDYSKEIFITAKLMPTNDIVVNIPCRLANIFSVKLDLGGLYSDEQEDLKAKCFIDLIKGVNSSIPKPVIVHVPEDPFDNVTALLDAAASTPDRVKEICITAYRLSDDSDIINCILKAIEKKIYCKLYLELSARGEIENDLKYLAILLKAPNRKYLDIKVRYNGIKVHGKMIYIGLRPVLKTNSELGIGVFSTGNYNEDTAKIYKDYHYISCEHNVIDMIRRNFSVLWNSQQPVLSSISNILSKEIYQEIAKGKDGRIWIQTNHLDNKHIVNLLREAIHRGCDVKLIVRTTKGFHNKDLKNCKTVVGKYLEHSRVYIFGSRNTKDRRVYLSSSDILFRNLYNRFESYVSINDPNIMDSLDQDFRSLYKNGQSHR